jgi:hypothetical protein
MALDRTVGEQEMATNVVNLDALIPRDDFMVDDGPQRVTPGERIKIVDLDNHFFANDLRKPDFQRETIQWTPNKVVDLIRSFLDADLIPAVILWRAGRNIFVIDGAHRLSALLAWILDDYGDRKRSIEHSGSFLPDEQTKIAERTRELVRKSIGTYQLYKSFINNRDAAPPEIHVRLSNLGDNALIAQWVPATDAKSAEASFFTINQQGTPIDPVERQILKSRDSASAIASRAITHGGSGHRYWENFAADTKHAIESISRSIYTSLFNPPITSMPITTLDVPVAGKGYNPLPFVFDLVNQANGVRAPEKSNKKAGVEKDKLPPDADGATTVEYLKAVKRRVDRITGDQSMSLGLHPVVYFYTRSGSFQLTVFLAVSAFMEDLARRAKLKNFTIHRKAFEDFLVEHKEAPSLLIKRLGSGPRHMVRLREYYGKILDGFAAGHSGADIQASFANENDYAFLTVPRPTDQRPASQSRGSFKSATKTAAYLAAALPTGPRCCLCGALVHKNSIQFDHEMPRREGGATDMSNARVTHPYCNSIRDHLPTAGASLSSASSAAEN